MAEIRKHDPAAGNAIAQALQAAMGEPVRPNQPGRPTRPVPRDEPAEAAPEVTTWVSFTVAKPDGPSATQ